MQKLSVLLITILGIALIVPIFADEISDVITNTNGTNETNDTLGNNSSVANNTTLTNTTLTAQLQVLTDTQNKLTALIAKIESLKSTYGNNTKAKGLLNALDQYEKQANRLNAEISAFMQNSTVSNSTESIDGRINSFVKREAALEHKVLIKERLLLKMSTKKVKTKEKVANKNKTQKNKNNNK